MSEQLGELVDSSVAQEGRLTLAYLQGLYEEAGITPTAPRVPLSKSQRIGITSTAEAYQRVPAAYRSHLSRGGSHEEALAVSMDRLRNMLETDLQLAHTEMTRRVAVVNKGTTTGFRRIIRPELSGGNVCGLCIVAADRVYSISDLMPLHSGCNCDTAPVTKDFDPGLNLNREDLDALYHAAGGDETSAAALRQVKLSIYDHGEIGPVLKPEGQAHQTPSRAFSRSNSSSRPPEERPNFQPEIDRTRRAIDRLSEEMESGQGDSLTAIILERQRAHLSTLETRQKEQ